MYKVVKYTSDYFEVWNQFIDKSKNGTFLFHRNFMEYHKDRFEDFSLLVFKGSKLMAVLPANRVGESVYSHQGLTYGGILLPLRIGFYKAEQIFETIILYLKSNSISNLIFKTVPSIYFKQPSYELEMFLFTKNALIFRREQSLAIDYSLDLNIHKSKLKKYEKNKDFNFEIREGKETEFTIFWEEVLEPRLKEKHNASPVHTSKEILKLKNSFSDKISQFNIYLKDEILAGITIFKTQKVVKSQYGAVTTAGENFRALDFLFINLILRFRNEGFNYFDMGTVIGNMSLLKQKEELGCYQYLQDYYKLKIS